MEAALLFEGSPDLRANMLNTTQIQFSVSLARGSHRDERYLCVHDGFCRICRCVEMTCLVTFRNDVPQTWFQNRAAPIIEHPYFDRVNIYTEDPIAKMC